MKINIITSTNYLSISTRILRPELNISLDPHSQPYSASHSQSTSSTPAAQNCPATPNTGHPRAHSARNTPMVILASMADRAGNYSRDISRSPGQWSSSTHWAWNTLLRGSGSRECRWQLDNQWGQWRWTVGRFGRHRGPCRRRGTRLHTGREWL